MAIPLPERLMELLAINRAIAAATEYDDLPALVVERTAAFLRAEIVVLLLADEDGSAVSDSLAIFERSAGFQRA